MDLIIPNFEFQQEQNFPFRIELLSADAGYNSEKPHRHNYYELFFFERGGGMHMIDFHELEILKHHIHIVQPNQVHYMKRKKGSKGLVIKFPVSFLSSGQEHNQLYRQLSFLNNVAASSSIELPQTAFEEVKDILHNISIEYQSEKNYYKEIIIYNTFLVLTLCQRYYKESAMKRTDSSANQLLIGFQDLLEKNYIAENRLAFYCTSLGVSIDKLNASLKQSTGKTAGQLINQRLLLEAKRLLLHSDQSIKEIAYQLNFNDNAYFNRWFRKLTQLAPGAFRCENRKKYHT